MDDEDFTEGEIFNTCEEFHTKLRKFEAKQGLKFSTKSSHLLPQIHQHLKYAEVLYRCPRAGVFKSKGEGTRTIKSRKTDCQAYIKIKADKERSYIVVDEFKPAHNHALPQGEDRESFVSGSTSKKAKVPSTSERPPIDTKRKILESLADDLVQVVMTSSTELVFEKRLEAIRLLLRHFNTSTDAQENKEESVTEHGDSYLNPSEFLAVKLGNGDVEDDCTAQPSTNGKKAHSLVAAATEVFQSEGSNPARTSADEDRVSATAADKPADVLGTKADVQICREKVLERIKNDVDHSMDPANVGADVPNTEVEPPVDRTRIESKYDGHSDDSGKHYDDTIPAGNVVTESAASGSAHQDLTAIVMPKKRGKGRPKGAVLTAIGSPRKVHIPRMFNEKSDVEKARYMLSWLVEETVIDKAMNGKYRLCETDLQLDSLRESFLDNSVDLKWIKLYCENKALALLKKTVNMKRKNKVFTCRSCQKGVSDKSVLCGSCLLWRHHGCVGLKRAPRASPWFCPECREK